ncbi:sulfotransferase family protein [Catalinimonas sp. 4WD22]|uniref:sulfotransferase family protein n=1 Tax=Catalinimonas locisalis TaxID=3133978 RepID=UPI00310146B9
METVKIFCIGLSRTGTTSLCQALEILGYNTIHFPIHLFTHPEVISDELSFEPKRKLNLYWNWRRRKELEVLNLKFDKDMMNKYEAFGDLPVPLLFETLDRKFPGSKFIYTYRDEKKWLKSMKWLYKEGAVLWKHGLLNDEINIAAYGTVSYDSDRLLDSYRRHHQHVMQHFVNRPDDLLVLNIDKEKITLKQLSEFLSIETINTFYPKANKSKKVSKQQMVQYWLERNLPFYGLIKKTKI